MEIILFDSRKDPMGRKTYEPYLTNTGFLFYFSTLNAITLLLMFTFEKDLDKVHFFILLFLAF